LRAAVNVRRFLDLVTMAIDNNLDQDAECPRCELHGVRIEVVLRRSGDEFRARRIRVVPEYGPLRPLTGRDKAP